MYAKKSSAKKILVVLLAAVLLIGVGVGGTLAWLTATSGTVTNTFTVGDVNIELKEHDLVDGVLTTTEVDKEDTYKIVPGTSQPKDPFVRVKANSEDSWIFVQIKEVNNTAGTNLKYVDWSIGTGWTQLGEAVDGVYTYYRAENYATTGTDVTYNVLAVDDTKGANGFVSYNSNLTKANLEDLDKDAVDTTGYGTIDADEMPQLIFKAFAVQAEASGNAATAWGQIDSTAKLS